MRGEGLCWKLHDDDDNDGDDDDDDDANHDNDNPLKRNDDDFVTPQQEGCAGRGALLQV